MESDFISMGTPMPLLTTEEEELKEKRNKYVPVWKQEVRDEKGRQRFHGAFTGGFSAGYFNTVGSLEGFTPGTFVSSRKQRGKKHEWKPEDFMDEEDLQEIRDSKELRAKEDYRATEVSEGTESYNQTANERELISTFIESLITPKQDSIGMRLLQAMGWREGQSVGPRRKRQISEDFYEFEEQQSKLDMIDYRSFCFSQKQDLHGLDFKSSNTTTTTGSSRNSSKIVLDETSFHKENKRLAMTGPLEHDDLYGDEKYTSRKWVYKETVIENQEDSTETFSPSLKHPSHNIHLIHENELKFELDGRPVIEGFRRSRQKLVQEKWFAPPNVPKDFVSIHYFDGPANPVKMTLFFESSWPVTTLQVIEKRSELLGEDFPKPAQPTALKEKEVQLQNSPSLIPLVKQDASSRTVPSFLTKMSDRFVTETKEDISKIIPETVSYVKDKEKNEAVSMKMFGQLTRTKHVWIPDPILCKRFNIMNPYPGHKAISTAKELLETENQLEQELKSLSEQRQSERRSESQPSERLAFDKEQESEISKDVGNIIVNIDTKDEGPAIDYERPSMDLFKSIFEDDIEELEKSSEIQSDPNKDGFVDQKPTKEISKEMNAVSKDQTEPQPVRKFKGPTLPGAIDHQPIETKDETVKNHENSIFYMAENQKLVEHASDRNLETPKIDYQEKNREHHKSRHKEREKEKRHRSRRHRSRDRRSSRSSSYEEVVVWTEKTA